jgi:hypothetical protein
MTLDFWRNVAVIWLCFQGFFLLIVPLAIAYFLVRGINWVVRKTPPLFHTLQGYSGRMRNMTEALANKAAEPVIRAHAKSRETEAVFDTLFRTERSPKGNIHASVPPSKPRAISVPDYRREHIRKD